MVRPPRITRSLLLSTLPCCTVAEPSGSRAGPMSPVQPPFSLVPPPVSCPDDALGEQTTLPSHDVGFIISNSLGCSYRSAGIEWYRDVALVED